MHPRDWDQLPSYPRRIISRMFNYNIALYCLTWIKSDHLFWVEQTHLFYLRWLTISVPLIQTARPLLVIIQLLCWALNGAAAITGRLWQTSPLTTWWETVSTKLGAFILHFKHYTGTITKYATSSFLECWQKTVD